jgi:SAM-dependent methyltransferase
MSAAKTGGAEKGNALQGKVSFWEKMADRYPRPFEEKTLAQTKRVISIVKGKGVAFKNGSVLDIGCGTGIYALALAREAARVTGIDSSEAMIALMRKEIELYHLPNVQTIIQAWKDVNISEMGFEKAFDVVWASMTPAVQNENDFIKMEQCSKNWCVYIGWGRKRKNPLMEAAFTSHGLNFGPPPGVAHALKLLFDAGKNPSLEYIETWWDWSGTLEEAVDDVTGFMTMQQTAVDPEKLRKIIAPYERHGKVYHKTEAEEGILTWQVR